MTSLPLSIVIPCHNEEENISALMTRLEAVLGDYKTQDAEIILVDDGSSDGTWPAIEQLCKNTKNIIGIRLSRNFGHQMALAAGLDHAKGQRMLVMDADLQDPPELLIAMMQKMDEGFDVVYGQRTSREGETGFKKISAWLYYRLLGRLSDVPIPPDAGDFRLMSRRVVDALIALPERIRFTRGLVAWLGFKQTAIEYTRDARHAGNTHYPLRAMLRLAGVGLTSFSTRPLQLAIWLGLAMMLFSLALLAYVFLSWLLFDTVRGWTSLAAIFLMSQAAQWLMLGIIGNYLAVVFRETKARPLYLVDKMLNR